MNQGINNPGNQKLSAQHSATSKSSRASVKQTAIQSQFKSTVIRTEYETMCIFTLEEQRKLNTVTTHYP